MTRRAATPGLVMMALSSLLLPQLAVATPAREGGQTAVVQVPVAAPQITAAWRCQISLATPGGGTYHAGRDLDADGRIIGESLQWTDGHIGDRSVVPTQTVEWHTKTSRQSFGDGVLGLWFYGRQAMKGPLRLAVVRDGVPPLYRAAGRAWSIATEAESYVPAAELLTYAGDRDRLGWRIETLDAAGQPTGPAHEEGDMDLSALRAAQAAFPGLEAALDAAAADPQRNCRRP